MTVFFFNIWFSIALIFPLIYLFNLVNFLSMMKISLFFTLLMGVYHEWNQNMLDWKN